MDICSLWKSEYTIPLPVDNKQKPEINKLLILHENMYIHSFNRQFKSSLTLSISWVGFPNNESRENWRQKCPYFPCLHNSQQTNRKCKSHTNSASCSLSDIDSKNKIKSRGNPRQFFLNSTFAYQLSGRQLIFGI